MCGRYYVDLDEDGMQEIARIIRQVEKNNSGKKIKAGEIFPTNTAPLIISDAGQQEEKITAMKWGFPRWDGKGVVINARSETAHEKRMFSKPLKQQRCVILANGFYEWQKIDSSKSKDKFLFRADESKVMYMAGLWNKYKDQESFVILTRDANICIADIHDRMPVIMYKDEIDNWLSDDNFVDFIFRRDNIMLQRMQIS